MMETQSTGYLREMMILFYPKSVHSIFDLNEKPLKYAVIKLDISRINVTANYSPENFSAYSDMLKRKNSIYFNAAQTEKIFTKAVPLTNVLMKWLTEGMEVIW